MEKLRYTGCVTTLCFLGFILGACTTTTQQQPEESNAISQAKNIRGMPGISGLAALSEDSFLVVHDAKHRKSKKPKKPRLGLLTTDHQEEKIRYTEIAAPEAISPPTSDLEDVCAIPGSDGEFLVNESGTFEGNFGRIFHIKITDFTASLLFEHPLPFTQDNTRDGPDGDQFEGLACAKRIDDRILIILGDRGGAPNKPTAKLRWGLYDLPARSLSWSTGSLDIAAPNPFKASSLRAITALDIDEDGFLYASASVDSGTDLGPFRSIVYRIGRVNPDADIPVVTTTSEGIWILDGLKVEGVETRGRLSIGAEDENLGGVWRELSTTPIQNKF